MAQNMPQQQMQGMPQMNGMQQQPMNFPGANECGALLSNVD